jgi:hypothetical protein
MPGGKYDSSKTRVRPVFDALWNRGRNWVPQLLKLPTGGCANAEVASSDLTIIKRYWEPHEKCLNPPVSLLSWLIRNVKSLSPRGLEGARQRLPEGDPETIEDALHRLRTDGDSKPRAWYIFEGQTQPDVYLVAHDALVVVEGKRTERTTTTDTSWLSGRHQIWRHIDAAWEIRGRRAVYGFFIVESDATSADGSVPEPWRDAGRACLSPAALLTSFPHRSAKEVEEISRCFLGVTTWRKVCEQFDIDWRRLPPEASSLGAK